MKDPAHPDFSQKILEDFAKSASVIYLFADPVEIDELFMTDFQYWEKVHFDAIGQKTRSELRKILVERGKVPLVTGTGYPISKILSEYLDKVRAEEEEDLEVIRVDLAASQITTRRVADARTDVGGRRIEQHEVEDFVPLHRRNRLARLQARVSQETSRNDLGSGNTSSHSSRGRPSDVAKIFSCEERYSGRLKKTSVDDILFSRMHVPSQILSFYLLMKY